MFIIMALLTYSTDMLRENLQGIIERRGFKKRRALDMFMRKGKGWDSVVIEHPHGTNYFGVGTANAAYNDSVTTIVILKDPQKPILPKVNQKYYVKETGEQFISHSSSANITNGATTITFANITRGYNDTTAAAISQGDTIIMGTDVLAENTDQTGSDHFTSERQDYFSQIFIGNLAISGSMEAISEMIANGDGNFNTLIQDQLDFLEMRQLYQEMFRGIHGASDSLVDAVTGAADNRQMDGIINAIKRLDGIQYDVNGSLDFAVLDAQLGQIVNLDGPIEQDLAENSAMSAFGPSPYVGFVNPTGKNRINFLDANSGRIRREQKDYFAGNFIGSTFGALPVDWVVVPEFCVFDDEAVIIRKDQYDLAPVNKRQFAFEKMGKTGDGNKWQIVGEYAGVLNFPECGLYLYGIS